MGIEDRKTYLFLFFLIGAWLFFLLHNNFPLGWFGDIHQRLGDSLQNNQIGINALINTKTLFFQLHPPLDYYLRYFFGFFYLNTPINDLISYLIFSKIISTVFLVFSIKNLSNIFTNKLNFYILNLLISLSFYSIFQGLFFSLTESSSLFFVSLSCLYFKRHYSDKSTNTKYLSFFMMYLASLIRPEIVFLQIAMLITIVYEKFTKKDILIFLLINFNYLFIKYLLIFSTNIDSISYLNFPQEYFSNKFNLTFLYQSLVSRNILSISTLVYFLFFCFSIKFLNFRKELPNIFFTLSFLTFIFIILLFVPIFAGYGKPEPRLFIIFHSLFAVLLSYLVYRHNSLLIYFFLSILIFASFQTNYFSINKDVDRKKQHNAINDEVTSFILKNQNNLFLFDYLKFNEWIIRYSLLDSKFNHNNLCMFSRCLNNISLAKINKNKMHLGRHDEFFLRSVYFLANYKPKFIISINKKEFIKFNSTYLNIHKSIVHDLSTEDSDELFFENINLRYKKIKSINYFDIYRHLD